MRNKDFCKFIRILFDTLFVMILCFAVLLTTMLVSKTQFVRNLNGYVIKPLYIAAVTVCVGGYLMFVLRQKAEGEDEDER